jgi:hypothetical protein
MFKPNTVAVPRQLILQVGKENLNPDAVYFAALRVMYPRKNPQEIADKFHISDEVVGIVEDFMGADYEEDAPAPRQKRERSGGSGNYNQQRQQYPESPPAPKEFVEWFKTTFKEIMPNPKKPVHDKTINAIYEKFEGDEEFVEAAIMVTADVNDNQTEVNSPGGFILKQAGDGKERVLYKADLIENQGTAIKNKESRMNRARERSRDYLSKAPPADYSADFLDNEEEGDDDV